MNNSYVFYGGPSTICSYVHFCAHTLVHTHHSVTMLSYSEVSPQRRKRWKHMHFSVGALSHRDPECVKKLLWVRTSLMHRGVTDPAVENERFLTKDILGCEATIGCLWSNLIFSPLASIWRETQQCSFFLIKTMTGATELQTWKIYKTFKASNSWIYYRCCYKCFTTTGE